MTKDGGSNSFGNVFSSGTDGTNFQNILSFTGTTGSAIGGNPYGSLILSGTTLYGMTAGGGINGDGNVFSVGIDGSDYQSLYSFTGGTDGSFPAGDLTLSGGTLFGMTEFGGNLSLSSGQGDGTVFALALPTPMPEPGTVFLASTAAAALISYRWRREPLPRAEKAMERLTSKNANDRLRKRDEALRNRFSILQGTGRQGRFRRWPGAHNDKSHSKPEK